MSGYAPMRIRFSLSRSAGSARQPQTECARPRTQRQIASRGHAGAHPWLKSGGAGLRSGNSGIGTPRRRTRLTCRITSSSGNHCRAIRKRYLHAIRSTSTFRVCRDRFLACVAGSIPHRSRHLYRAGRQPVDPACVRVRRDPLRRKPAGSLIELQGLRERCQPIPWKKCAGRPSRPACTARPSWRPASPRPSSWK